MGRIISQFSFPVPQRDGMDRDIFYLGLPQRVGVDDYLYILSRFAPARWGG